MIVEKKKRGRPRKTPVSLEEQEDEVIQKWLGFEPMSLDEAALGIWMHEGRKMPKPLSKMRILQIEASALKKLRDGLKKYGINSLDDVFDPKYRKCGNRNGYVDGED